MNQTASFALPVHNPPSILLISKYSPCSSFSLDEYKLTIYPVSQLSNIS
jgi:hypothetical protein